MTFLEMIHWLESGEDHKARRPHWHRDTTIYLSERRFPYYTNTDLPAHFSVDDINAHDWETFPRSTGLTFTEAIRHFGKTGIRRQEWLAGNQNYEEVRKRSRSYILINRYGELCMMPDEKLATIYESDIIAEDWKAV